MRLSGRFIVKAVRKETSAVFFKDLKAGDVFELSYTLNGWYHSAPAINILQNGEKVHLNKANQLRNNLANFEIEQVG